MKTANIAQLKNGLSAYLAEVKRGGEVLVSERNVPFAKIVPHDHTDDYDAETNELIAQGLADPWLDSTDNMRMLALGYGCIVLSLFAFAWVWRLVFWRRSRD